MATKYGTSCEVGSGIQPRAGLGFTAAVGLLTHDSDTDLNTADVVQLVKIPAGATILDGYVAVRAAGLDTGATIDWTLGDTDSTDDTDRYITTSTVGQSSGGGVVRFNNPVGFGYKFAADGTIDMTISTGSGTNVATGVVTCVVFYTMDA